MGMALRGRLRRLFGNLGLKFLALALAVAFWFFLASGREAYRELDVPVELKGLPEGIVVNGRLPEYVSVRVAGKGRDLLALGPDDFKVVINVADKEAGVHRLDLAPSDVIYAGSREVEVEEILSEKIVMLELERRVTKSVPVKVDFVGSLAADLYLGVPEVDPPKATLYGSFRVLEKVRAVSVTVDADGREGPFTAQVPIRAPAGITLVGSDEARVTVPVGPGERRTVTGVPLTARGARPGEYRLLPAEVAVTWEGEPGRLEALRPPAAHIYPKGPGRYAVGVDVPDYVTLVAIVPAGAQAVPAGPPE
jgi:YbbR domain-containing protein